MALDLNEYIKMSYKRPNRKVLEGLGASEDLIEYLMETPGNTNWNVLGSIGESSGGDEPEVWLVGDTGTDAGGGFIQFLLSNVDDTDHITELLNNGENYRIYLNGEELPYFYPITEPYIANGWTDADTEENATKSVSVFQAGSQAIYLNASIAPTSVEVSVKAK